MGDQQALLQTAQSLPGRLEALAARLEKGQAVAPLSEAAVALRDFARASQELSLALIGMTPEARALVLNWLIGPQHQSVSVKLSEPLALLEIRLQERGFALQSDLAGRREFSSPDDFLAALDRQAESSAVDSGLIEPLRLGLAAPPPLRNLTILAPGQARLAAVAGVLSNIATRNAVLLVAAPPAYPWNQDDLIALAMAAENSLAVWPVLTGEADGGERELLALLARLQAPLLPMARLARANAAFIPGFIAGGLNHPLRQAIALAAHQRRCRSLLDMIGERYDADVRQMESRHKREARLERAAEAAAKEQDVKAILDRCKSQFNEELGRVLQTLRENARRSLMKSGGLGQALEALLASLQAADLERETAHKTIRLSLKPAVLAEFRKRLGKALRQQINEDCTLVRDSLDLLRQSSEQALAAAGATTRSLALAAPDNRALWDAVSDALQLEIKYRGELPRRGFWQRMAEGRRIVFVAMMLLSLTGSFLGFNIRQIGIFGILLLLLFLGGILYTYTSWRKEETESLDKEIDKVKESAQQEFSRALNDILRDHLAHLQQILDDLKKDGAARLDNALREAQHNKAQSVEMERREARDKLRMIEQRLKEMKPLGQEIGKLGEELARLGQEARALIAACAKPEAAA
jgi:hypothetical protein